MTSADIRRLFLHYFETHGHTHVASGSLIPAGDATLLFTNAGMVQFKDVFLGRDKRSYVRATTSQCCIRAGGKHNDLENVGYTARHHTFFEMLGNFSFGDYFKQEAIHFAWDFLTKPRIDGALGLPPEKLWVTVYEKDDEAADIWANDIGIPRDRIKRCGEKDNFWSMGDTGPCGPCTEIFYDHGPEIPGPKNNPDIFDPEDDNDRYIEIWNLVFMQFNRTADGQMHPLPKPSVDTGMGLERLSAVMQGVHSNYDIDVFRHLIAAITSLAGGEGTQASLQVIADHIRSSAFLIAEGIYPSNEGRGYVLRRIIRRALRHGAKLGIERLFFYQLVKPLIDVMGEAYPILVEKQTLIERVLCKEEEQFAKTLTHGLVLLEHCLSQVERQVISGDIIFKLYDTYGFPVDLTADIAREKNLTLDMPGFEAAMQKQRMMSQKAGTFKVDYNAVDETYSLVIFQGYEHVTYAGKIQHIITDKNTIGIILDNTPFYAESGGQIGDTGELYQHERCVFIVQDTQKIGNAIVHYGYYPEASLAIGDTVQAKVNETKRQATRLHHSATHLLHAALHAIVGQHAEQKGSLVTPEKTRFDFSHHEALTQTQIEQIEAWVNDKILRNVPIETAVLPFEQAKTEGAMALFGEKYGDTVRVLSMGIFSKELCGGTHAQRTGDIGLFKIIAENSVASGVRRIEAVAGIAALHWIQAQARYLQQADELLHCHTEQLPQKIEHVLTQQKELQKNIEQLHLQLSAHACDDLLKQAESIAGVNILIASLVDQDAKNLRSMMDTLKNKLGSAVIILVSIQEETIQIIAGLSKDCINKVPNAKTLVQMIGEKGGGRDDLAQGGAKKPADLTQRLDAVRQKLIQSLTSEPTS